MINLRKKKIIEDLILYIINISECARREGLLALEEKISHLNQDENNSLFIGLKLIIDGTDRKKIKEYFKNKIYNSTNYFNETLLRIIKCGLLSIQVGDNTTLLITIMSSVVPKKFRIKNLLKKYNFGIFDFLTIEKRIFE